MAGNRGTGKMNNDDDKEKKAGRSFHLLYAISKFSALRFFVLNLEFY
jgi:hypothetical protein